MNIRTITTPRPTGRTNTAEGYTVTKVLIVYENIPESTDLFIVDANECEVKDLELSHGN